MFARQMIWVTRGPGAGQFMEADADDAEQAEADGWAQRTVDGEGRMRSHMEMLPAERGSHEKAEAWLARQPGYANRELRAAPAPAPAPPKAAKDDDDDQQPDPKAKPAAVAPKKK
jgi:hypothetical protein